MRDDEKRPEVPDIGSREGDELSQYGDEQDAPVRRRRSARSSAEKKKAKKKKAAKKKKKTARKKRRSFFDVAVFRHAQARAAAQGRCEDLRARSTSFLLAGVPCGHRAAACHHGC